MTSLRDDAKALQGDLATLRRELHQIPEIGLDLPQTQARVLAALDGLPLSVSTGTSVSSVVAVLRGGRGVSGSPALDRGREEHAAAGAGHVSGSPALDRGREERAAAGAGR